MNTAAFNFSRLGLVMKRDLMENWKTNLYRILGPYAGFLLAILSCYMVKCDFHSFSTIMLGAFTLVMVFGGIFNASLIMENMNTQQKRISYLMLPATSLEKFIVRAIYVTFGFFFTMVIALLLAEGTRFMLLPLFELSDDFQQSVIPFIWEKLTTVELMKFTGAGAEESYRIAYLMEIISILVIFWTHSFFVLGGCYWQKHPFWKTLGVIILFNHLVGLFFVLLVSMLEGKINWSINEEWLETHLNWVTIEGVLSFIIVLCILLLALNWWLSYRCFTRSQVIKSKFRLL